jgi:hypothetical protein
MQKLLITSLCLMGIFATVVTRELVGAEVAPHSIEVGCATCDVTPEIPIWLAGYSARKKPADRIDHPLAAQALALRNPGGEPFVLVSLDNCEVNREFMQPVLDQCAQKHGLRRGAVAVVSSHTHSAPVLVGPLSNMYFLSSEDDQRIANYSRLLQQKLVDVVGAAIEDLQPATLEHEIGSASFAMNRRVYHGDRVDFGDNPDGPVDWNVPVLRIRAGEGAVKAILFGYACHGTSVRSGDDWYVVSGDYMAYARQHLERLHPGAIAIYLTGMGADSDPSPRGRLLDAQRHGLELAGAVMSVLNRPMRQVSGTIKLAYDELELPFVDSPSRERLVADGQSADPFVKGRAERFLRMLDAGKPMPTAVRLPLGVLRIGDDLSWVLMGGEVVVDYSRALNRLLASDHPWLVGYAYDVPCYIPSVRLIKEGGYESDYSLTYYGYYGPFRASIEESLIKRVTELVESTR